MKFHLTAFLAIAIASSAFAAEPLHTFPASGIELHATGSVESVTVEGNFVQFHFTDLDIFATALVFRDTVNDYPQLLAFSEQFLNTAFPGDRNQIAGEIEVHSEFANSTVVGREYLIDAESGVCELLLAHSVGNRTYMFFNVTDPSSSARCVDASSELRSAVNKITASIAISGN